MRATVNKEECKKKLVAVVLNEGSIVFQSAFITDDCSSIRISSNGTSGTSTHGLKSWAETINATPVYEGDTVTLQF